jgi:hypothetical protein
LSAASIQSISSAQEKDPTSGTDDQPFRFTALLLEIFEQCHQTVVEFHALVSRQFPLWRDRRLAETLAIERLQQVVEGIQLESLDCIVVARVPQRVGVESESPGR